jgi:cupin fold WbuC family metalloprotein
MEWTADKMEGFRRIDGKTVTFWPETATSIGTVSDEIIRELLSERRNARICFHISPDAEFHDMLIAEWRDLYSFPLHRHTKPETIQIIRGETILRLFTGNGPVVRKPLFRDAGLHIPRSVWHQAHPVSEYVVYREIKEGPFQPSDNELWTGDDPE